MKVDKTEILKKIEFDVVKLPIEINISDYEISDLLSDSYRKYIKITDDEVKIIKQGRFAESAEIGYRQVYKTVEKKVEKPEEWYSSKSAIYFLFKNKNNKNVVIRVDLTPFVKWYETNNFDHKERGEKPSDNDVVLFEGVYSITNASTRTVVYWIEGEVFEMLREEAKKLV
jgi:hypothetical protein